MMTRPNSGGGTTVTLTPGDELVSVPDSHQNIVTDSVRDAFCDPVAYFSEIASRTSILNLRKYLTSFVANGRWSLLLADTNLMHGETIAAFQWSHPAQLDCMLGLPAAECENELFTSFYDCLSMVHWDSIGFAGGIVPSYRQILVADYGAPSTNRIFPADKTIVFGNSSSGDMMICNPSGDAGYLSHETGESYLIGSFPEMLEWIFGELIRNRTPEFDYSRCK